jgi:hypothetical protein
MFKKFLTFSLFIILLFFLFINFTFAAERKLELQYPQIPGARTPTFITKNLLPDYVKYIFNLSIGISGLIAFGVLIFAGLRYLTSAGNPAVMADAQDQIFSAFLGLIILLCAWIILTTINPQLVTLELPELPTP